MAKPKLGSTSRVAYAVNAPGIGRYVANSPSAAMTEKTIEPTKMYAIRAPTGPAVATAAPLPINRPVPIVPPEY
jgi:hypothetical protein